MDGFLACIAPEIIMQFSALRKFLLFVLRPQGSQLFTGSTGAFG